MTVRQVWAVTGLFCKRPLIQSSEAHADTHGRHHYDKSVALKSLKLLNCGRMLTVGLANQAKRILPDEGVHLCLVRTQLVLPAVLLVHKFVLVVLVHVYSPEAGGNNVPRHTGDGLGVLLDRKEQKLKLKSGLFAVTDRQAASWRLPLSSVWFLLPHVSYRPLTAETWNCRQLPVLHLLTTRGQSHQRNMTSVSESTLNSVVGFY